MFWEAYDTSHDLYPDAEPHDDYFNKLDSNKAVDEYMEPTVFEIRAFNYAIQSYHDFERYGFPYEGGLKNQVWVWKLAVDCVKDALAAGSAQARAEARHAQD